MQVYTLLDDSQKVRVFASLAALVAHVEDRFEDVYISMSPRENIQFNRTNVEMAFRKMGCAKVYYPHDSDWLVKIGTIHLEGNEG